jgi:hypothetical protein
MHVVEPERYFKGRVAVAQSKHVIRTVMTAKAA